MKIKTKLTAISPMQKRFPLNRRTHPQDTRITFMKSIRFLPFIAAMCVAAGALADVPSIINYQARLSAGGTNVFNGPGQFKFALVNGGTNLHRQATAVATVSNGFLTGLTPVDGGLGYGETPAVTITDVSGSNAVAIAQLTDGAVSGFTIPNPGRHYSPTPTVTIAPPPPNYAYLTFWSNDGSSAAGGEPTQAVPVQVNQGVFSVNLGDTSLSNMTAQIAPSIFTNSDIWLRIWFSDGVTGFQQFYPDQRLTSAGYAMMAANVVDGAITGNKLAQGAVGATAVATNGISSENIADGAITTAKLADEAVTTPKLADGVITSAKLAQGAVSGSAVAANGIGSEHIADGAIATGKLADGAVTAPKLAVGAISGFPNAMAVFTNGGTWIKPPGVTRVHVKLWGGGGGGFRPGGNRGGAGGYCEGIVTVTGDVSVSVGLGGAGATNAPAAAGGTSSFLSLTANGGNGDEGGVESSAAGGSASGGALNLTGGTGLDGGIAPMGGGQARNSGPHVLPVDGTVPGGGGREGGAGAPGMVIVYW